MTMPLTAVQLDELEATVHQIEATTDGELVTVIAADSDDDTTQDALLLAALAGLLIPAVFVWAFSGSVGLMYTLQVMVFLGVYALIEHIPTLRFSVLPRSITADRVRRHAIEQFHLNGLHRTSNQLGVMVFVSLAEQQVEILADRGFDDTVSDGAWQNVVNALVARVQQGELQLGLSETVEACAGVMAKAAPATQDSANVLPNRLIVITRD